MSVSKCHNAEALFGALGRFALGSLALAYSELGSVRLACLNGSRECSFFEVGSLAACVNCLISPNVAFRPFEFFELS